MMAAGQQKKRLTSASLHEHYRGKKKKKPDSSEYVLNLRSQIHLEWDDTKRRAVAKREQVGISWMDMTPFVDSIPELRTGLADVLSVPQEIYGLDNLMEVLSYEVWATCLSESERKLLTQFLPGGAGAEQSVQSLLTGENHHFGNPFLKWSASLCAGNLHPDDALRMDRQIKSNKNLYFSELNKYHTNMLEVLQKWKERWTSCKDPEKLWRKGLGKHKPVTVTGSAETTKVTPVSKKEMPNKVCIRNGDAVKYMSYIKISRKQYELVKNMKPSGDGIQSKSLNRVLGDIKDFQIHPYEDFEVEEKNKLYDLWLQVVHRDLPVAFEEGNNRKLLREQQNKCLGQELAERKTLIFDKTGETEDRKSSPHEQIDDGDSENHPIHMIDQDDPGSPCMNSAHGHHLEHIPLLNSREELSPVMVNQDAVGQDITTSNVADANHLERIPSLNTRQELGFVAVDKKSIGQDILPSPENSFTSQFVEKDPSKSVVEPKASTSPSKDMWQPVRASILPTNSDTHHYSSSSELSLRQPQPVEHRASVIDLERDILEQETGESVTSSLHMDNGSSLYCSYPGQSHDELLPAFPKGPIMLPSYPHQHTNDLKQHELQFFMAHDSLSESDQFSHQYQGQQQLIEQRQAREEKEMYLHQMMNKSIYSHGRYPNQGQYPLVNGGLVGHNWFPDENQAHNVGWSGVGQSSSGGQCLGGGGNADGSLLSVLSECRKLPSRLPYEATSGEQFVQARNVVHGGISPNDGIYSFVPHQLQSSSNHVAASATPSALNMSWMSYPHQNSSLEDSIGKQFLRSWNQ